METSKEQQALSSLEQLIESGEWELGARLPAERSLALSMGASRNTVRNVLRILAGRDTSADAFASTCHGAGRALSRSQALKRTPGRDVLTQLSSRGILIRTNHIKGLAEEAPAAYKDIHQVVEASTQAGLTDIIARLTPLGCLKG